MDGITCEIREFDKDGSPISTVRPFGSLSVVGIGHSDGNSTEKQPSFHQFDSGAKRSTDADHVAFHLLPSKSLELAAMVMKNGEIKYGRDNWKKGLPVDDTLNHAIRHIYLWLDGDRSEPHLTNALCNLLFVNHFAYNELKPLIGSVVRIDPSVGTMTVTSPGEIRNKE